MIKAIRPTWCTFGDGSALMMTCQAFFVKVAYLQLLTLLCKSFHGSESPVKYPSFDYGD